LDLRSVDFRSITWHRVRKVCALPVLSPCSKANLAESLSIGVLTRPTGQN
jgi:hypothetical protein